MINISFMFISSKTYFCDITFDYHLIYFRIHSIPYDFYFISLDITFFNVECITHYSLWRIICDMRDTEYSTNRSIYIKSISYIRIVHESADMYDMVKHGFVGLFRQDDRSAFNVKVFKPIPNVRTAA